MSEGFVLIVRFFLKPDHAVEFDRLVEETTAKISESEPGTLVYVSQVPEGAPDQRIFYELYANKEAFEEHERQPHVKSFISERERHIERFEVEFLAEKAAAGRLFNRE